MCLILKLEVLLTMKFPCGKIWRNLKVCVLFSILVLPTFIGPAGMVFGNPHQVYSKENVNRSNSTLLTSKLLISKADYGEDPIDTCSSDDIELFQGPGSPLPSGIPTYTVEIMNACVTGCSICNIHVSCGWFSSARLIDPSIFRRLCYDDCLVNDGGPLDAGQAISFKYANSFAYPLSVSSVDCC